MSNLELVEPLGTRGLIAARKTAVVVLLLVATATFTLSGFSSPVTKKDIDPILGQVVGSITILAFIAGYMYLGTP